MKRSKFSLLACVLVCALLAPGFVGFASATATIKVMVTPSKSAINLGGTKQFKATVSGVRGATVTWSLDATSLANGCTISTSGMVSVPTTVTTPDSWNPVVTATYTGTVPAVSGTATFTITDPTPAPGLLIGTVSCTGGSCNGNDYDLAFNLKNKGTIDALVMEPGGIGGHYTTFHSMIKLKNNTVTGTYKLEDETYTLEGYVDYNSGDVADIQGSLYTAGVINPIGTWKVTLTTTGLAKVGTFTITDKSLFGAIVKGKLAGLTPQPENSTAIYGVAYVPIVNLYIPTSGTYDQSGNSVTFNFTYDQYTFTATGTFSANGKVSGDLLTGVTKVGTWSLQDL
jgi:hypothetical protein